MFSCNDDDNPILNSDEIEIEWILLKKNMIYYSGCDSNSGSTICDHTEDKYYRWFSSSDDIYDHMIIDNSYLNVFDHGNEYVFDVSDSFCNCNGCCLEYYENHNISGGTVDRIIYNLNHDYLTFFDNSYGTVFSLGDYEIIDFR